MNYLLDVNVLVAWGWADHSDHERTAEWIAGCAEDSDVESLFTSSIPQLGFVRVSVQRSRGRISPQQAAEVLGGMLATLGYKHRFLPDDADVRTLPEWCRGASKTTDAHLMALAEKHDSQLATLDQGIPGAFLLPGLDA